jgi:hypothetical protein
MTQDAIIEHFIELFRTNPEAARGACEKLLEVLAEGQQMMFKHMLCDLIEAMDVEVFAQKADLLVNDVLEMFKPANDPSLAQVMEAMQIVFTHFGFNPQ